MFGCGIGTCFAQLGVLSIALPTYLPMYKREEPLILSMYIDTGRYLGVYALHLAEVVENSTTLASARLPT